MEYKTTDMENNGSVIEVEKASVKRQKNPRKSITLLIAIIVAVVCIAVGFLFGRVTGDDTVPDDATISNQPDESGLNIENTTESDLSILSTTESDEWVTVETSFLTIRYPFAFSDVIEVDVYNDGLVSQLRFYANIDEKKILDYVIYFNSNEGMPCGTLKREKEIPVSVEFITAPDDLSEDWLNTFYAVQETFNDVLLSMEGNEKFFGVIHNEDR